MNMRFWRERKIVKVAVCSYDNFLLTRDTTHPELSQILSRYGRRISVRTRADLRASSLQTVRSGVLQRRVSRECWPGDSYSPARSKIATWFYFRSTRSTKPSYRG